jgi:hypothetical protein
MGPRIPPSLKWLINTRARLTGEIKKIEASTARVQSLLKELEQAKADLIAVDRTLGLHHLKVELDAIQPVISQPVRTNAPHGALTNNVLLCLRSNPDRCVRTSEVVAFVAARLAEMGVEPQDARQLYSSVAHRLKNLREQGVVANHRPKGNYGQGLWTIAKAMR